MDACAIFKLIILLLTERITLPLYSHYDGILLINTLLLPRINLEKAVEFRPKIWPFLIDR